MSFARFNEGTFTRCDEASEGDEEEEGEEEEEEVVEEAAAVRLAGGLYESFSLSLPFFDGDLASLILLQFLLLSPLISLSERGVNSKGGGDDVDVDVDGASGMTSYSRGRGSYACVDGAVYSSSLRNRGGRASSPLSSPLS